MRREDDQELWEVLGKASQPTLSPFFARNVLREIRQQPRWRENLARLWTPRRLVPAAAVAIALLVAGISSQWPAGDTASPDSLPESVAQLDEVDYEVVADLDDLLAMEEDTLWMDGDISTL